MESFLNAIITILVAFLLIPLWLYINAKLVTLGHLEGKEEFLRKKARELKQIRKIIERKDGDEKEDDEV